MAVDRLLHSTILDAPLLPRSVPYLQLDCAIAYAHGLKAARTRRESVSGGGTAPMRRPRAARLLQGLTGSRRLR